MESVFSNRLLSTRRGTMALGIGAGVLAAVILLVYLNRYRESISATSEPATVLVAKRLIQKGTPGDVIGSQSWFTTARIPQSELKDGAFTDPSTLRGRIAAADIYPGQQLAVADFTLLADATAVGAKLTNDQRALSVPLDAAHGMVGNIGAGDHVDVYAGFNVETAVGSKPVLKLLMPNALVLRGAESGGGLAGGGSGNLVLRASDQQAAEIAFAADNGKLWAVLRPAANARPTKPALVTVETVLFGVKPVVADRRVKKLLRGLR